MVAVAEVVDLDAMGSRDQGLCGDVADGAARCDVAAVADALEIHAQVPQKEVDFLGVFPVQEQKVAVVGGVRVLFQGRLVGVVDALVGVVETVVVD